MNFAAFLFWFLEFTLEVFGLFRSRAPLIKSTFAYLAAADVACLIISTQAGWESYIQAYWIIRAGKYLLLCGIAAVICGKLVKSNPVLTAVLMLGSALSGGLIIGLVFSHGATIGERLLDSGISAAMLLAGILLLGMAGKTKRLSAAWGLILAGLLVLLVGDVVVLMAAKLYWPAHHLKWFPEIAQLAMWNLAARAYSTELRLPLHANISNLPAESISRQVM